VQPDLCIICNPALIEERGCFGVPDLIIEILSPFSAKKDINNKYDVYEEAGVKEYWVVMPKEQLVEIFLLEGAKYQRKGTYVFENDITSSVLPSLIVPLSEVFEKKHEI
jgi:Uma2 family endonuclease